MVACSVGNSVRTRGNSPSSSRVVVRRKPPATSPSKPMMPVAGAGARTARSSPCEPAVSDLAVSASTRAGTRALASASVGCGSQVSSRSESRNRSVASSERSLPSISMRTPVSTGSMSSRPGRGDRLGDRLGEDVAAHRARRPPASPGRVGYSSTGIVCSVNFAEPQVSTTLAPSIAMSTGLVGQAAADVGEQPAGDQGPALVLDRGRDRWPGPRSRSRTSRAPARRRCRWSR